MIYIIIKNEINKVLGHAFGDDIIIDNTCNVEVSEDIFNEMLTKVANLEGKNHLELILNDDNTFSVIDNMTGIIGEYVW